LAELDLFFEFGRNEDGEAFWSLAPFSDAEGDHTDAVHVWLVLHETWLIVFSLEQLQSALPQEKLKTLLLFNPQLTGAKVGLVDEEGTLAIWVGQQIPINQINLEALKIAIGAVTVGVREVRKRLAKV
jgi:hypothetical protein